MIFHSRPELGELEVQACERVIRRGYLACGPETKAFEEELASRFQRDHAVVVSSGFAALHLSLLAMGVQKSQQVTIPSYCCTALLNAVHICGAIPKIVDTPYLGTHLNSHAVDDKSIVIAPQMFGVVQDLSGLRSETLIEDGAMSVGPTALRQGKISISSFYATKMMTTAQGGVVLTDDDAIADEVRDLIAYDNREEYKLRFNYAPNDLGSAVGRAQLSRLDEFLQARHSLAQRYDQFFKNHAPSVLAHPEGLASFGLGLFRYWIRLENLESVSRRLQEQGIEAKSPVFRPLHRYLNLSDHEYPHASQSQDTILSLPFYPSLKTEDQDKVMEALLPMLEKGITANRKS